jgi:hypothetical protein
MPPGTAGEVEHLTAGRDQTGESGDPGRGFECCNYVWHDWIFWRFPALIDGGITLFDAILCCIAADVFGHKPGKQK